MLPGRKKNNKQKRGPPTPSLKHSSEVKSTAQGELRSHTVTAKHHSLTCKSPQCRTGNAWGYLSKADKTTQLHLFFFILSLSKNCWGETLQYGCWMTRWAERSLHSGAAATYTGRTSCSPPRRPCSRRSRGPPPLLAGVRGGRWGVWDHVLLCDLKKCFRNN